MMRLRSIAAATGAIVLTSAFAFAPTSGQSSSPTATTSPSPAPRATASPKTLPADAFTLGDLTAADILKADPAPAGTWAPPAGYTGALRPGVWVQITGTDSCLNVRVSAGTTWHNPEGDSPIETLNCLPDGFVGQLSFGPNSDWSQGQALPVQADGYWWWYMLGQGWIAEDWLTLLQAEGSPYAARPELADAGLIAFMRSDGVWLMNADGTSPRLVYAVDKNVATVGSVRWSPDGERIAVGVHTWADAQNRAVTRIIDMNGAVIAEYTGLSEATWSPDGGRLAALRISELGELGGYKATPVVVGIDNGTETEVGPADYYLRGPEWVPDGSAVALMCRSWSGEELLPDGTVVTRGLDCSGDGLRAVSLADGSVRVIVPIDASGSASYMNPSWSPTGLSISMFTIGGDCDGYAIFDAISGSRTSCLQVPRDSFGGRCGGDSETGASDWTPDGRTLAYHWQSVSGQNGVALVDVTTGERRMILTTGSSSITFSSDGAHLSYESAGYVWTADTDASDVSRVTDGWLPAWQPRP